MTELINPIGTIYDNEVRTVVIHKGVRGARGLEGEEGDQGPPGDSINMVGLWQSGATYGPLDAVTWRSSALKGVDSLYIQISAWPEEVSTTPPNEDPARWGEVGLTTDEGLLGGVWRVSQASHPFTAIGQPAAFTAGGYVLANASVPNLYGIALVREVVDANTFILQSTGGIPSAEASVGLGGFIEGQLYYVSTSAGFLTADPPDGANQLVNAIYIHGVPEGIVLPWRPDLNQVFVKGQSSAKERFYYSATDGQVAFNGPDLNGDTPDFSDALFVECYKGGANLSEFDQYTTNGADTLTLVDPATQNERIEIWVEKLTPTSVYGRNKLDPIVFDGVAADFPLNIGGTTIGLTAVAADLDVYLDGNPQEPDVDYLVFDVGGQATISFAEVPEAHTGEWIILTVE